jgi:flagellar hook-basal body complex protein FliE
MSSSETNWQTELSAAIEDVENKLVDIKELAEQRHEAIEDYDEAIYSVRKAKLDVNHFIAVWNLGTRKPRG